jgi:hypothetical protein
MNEHITTIGRPVDPQTGVSLVHIHRDQWYLFRWPDYQRTPNMTRVKVIAKGIRDGYEPGPVTLYEQNGNLNIVDGGHRVKAYMHNMEKFSHIAPILAILYRENAIEQNAAFILENTKLRMNPSNIIRADHKSKCCGLIRAMGDPGGIFQEYIDLENYPTRPLTLIKAGIVLTMRDEELEINNQAYLSVANAVKLYDEVMTRKGDAAWTNLVKLVEAIQALWGETGRHWLNFGVLGFAFFLSKNAPRFFNKRGELEIKSTRLSVSEKRRAREFQDSVNSDFGKLAALRERWEERGDQLWIEASRNPLRIAGQINTHFWKNKPVSQRIWRPELSW